MRTLAALLFLLLLGCLFQEPAQASGDFGCNLYWQSATFYLLFYDTEQRAVRA